MTSGLAWKKKLETFFITLMPTISTIASYSRVTCEPWPLTWFTSVISMY